MSNALLSPGTRVMIDASFLDFTPLRAQIHGRTAIVLRYATAEIQRRQVWTEETYFVRLESDAPGVERCIDRSSLVVLP